MTDLKDEARSLFDTVRSAHEPRDDDRERVLKAVLLRAGVVATTTAVAYGAADAATKAGATIGAGGAVSGSLATVSVVGLGAKLLLGLAVTGALGAGLYHWTNSHSALKAGARELAQRAPRPTLKTVAPRLSTAATGSLALPQPEPLVEPAKPTRRLSEKAEFPTGLAPAARPLPVAEIAPAASEPTRSSASAAFPDQLAEISSAGNFSAPKSASTGAGLSDEARALAEVQRALREGKNARALTMVEGQQQRFTTGALGQERQAIKIVALCALGRVAEARSLAERFLLQAPRSPLAARVRMACERP